MAYVKDVSPSIVGALKKHSPKFRVRIDAGDSYGPDTENSRARRAELDQNIKAHEKMMAKQTPEMSHEQVMGAYKTEIAKMRNRMAMHDIELGNESDALPKKKGVKKPLLPDTPHGGESVQHGTPDPSSAMSKGFPSKKASPKMGNIDNMAGSKGGKKSGSGNPY